MDLRWWFLFNGSATKTIVFCGFFLFHSKTRQKIAKHKNRCSLFSTQHKFHDTLRFIQITSLSYRTQSEEKTHRKVETHHTFLEKLFPLRCHLPISGLEKSFYVFANWAQDEKFLVFLPKNITSEWQKIQFTCKRKCLKHVNFPLLKNGVQAEKKITWVIKKDCARGSLGDIQKRSFRGQKNRKLIQKTKIYWRKVFFLLFSRNYAQSLVLLCSSYKLHYKAKYLNSWVEI